MDHLDHIVKVGGINTAGLGFDFCGYLSKYRSVYVVDYTQKNTEEKQKRRLSDPSAVSGLDRDDEDIPRVTDELVKRGYSENDIELILGKNFLRVFEEVWK